MSLIQIITQINYVLLTMRGYIEEEISIYRRRLKSRAQMGGLAITQSKAPRIFKSPTSVTSQRMAYIVRSENNFI